MNLEKVVGVKCKIRGKFIFDEEKVVEINGGQYSVWDSNIGFVNGEAYVKAIRMLKAKGRIMVGINANDGYENVFVNKADLVTAA